MKIKNCDECESDYYFLETSDMVKLCPECSHLLYDYDNCTHEFTNGRCVKCYWDGSRSKVTLGLISENEE